MGGFAGGDEGGYWDEESTSVYIDKAESKNRKKFYIETSDSSYSIKAHAKGEEKLYDTISFVACDCETFTIEGCTDIPLESNTIYRAYKALDKYMIDSDISDFFSEYKVVVRKRIPLSSGLGGAASDAAAFICLIKEVCNLMLSSDELIEIGKSIDSDIAFFIENT